MNDNVFRLVAVVAAAALLAAPYRAQIQAIAYRAVEAGKAQAGLIGRIVAAGLLIAAAWGKVPLPRLPEGRVPAIVVETPSVEMQAIVAPVATAMKGMPAGDRLLWAQTWTKAGVVVAGDAVATEVVFSDTRSLRAFTALALDIAWRRIGGHEPDTNENLRVAVEAAYAKAMGVAEVTVTKDIRAQYAEFARAMAWAGYNRG